MRLVVGCGLLFAACHRTTGPLEPIRQVDTRTLYTCCNLHYDGDEINDANYWTGKTLPAGTAVRIEKLTKDSVTFNAGEQRLTLEHEYGTKQPCVVEMLNRGGAPCGLYEDGGTLHFNVEAYFTAFAAAALALHKEMRGRPTPALPTVK